jgi:hypothetical protein
VRLARRGVLVQALLNVRFSGEKPSTSVKAAFAWL